MLYFSYITFLKKTVENNITYCYNENTNNVQKNVHS